MRSKSSSVDEKILNQNFIINFIAGAGAGAISKTLTAPLERIKILFQVQNMKNSPFNHSQSIFNCLRNIYYEEGLVGYFRGNGANVV